MAIITGYIGGAGTGKSTRLIGKLTDLIQDFSWSEYNCVLALTFMHGSRKSLRDKLFFFKKERVSYKCQTIDSFATHIVERFRRIIGITKLITVNPQEKDDRIQENERTLYITWTHVRKFFIQLLGFKVVRDFIAASYPIIIIDEFQDCEFELLEIVKGLVVCNATILIAGDDFQQLNDSETCAATEWLKKNCAIEELTNIHRTKETTIISSALGLRNNVPIQNGLPVKVVSSPQLAAWHVSALIQWYSWGRKGKNVVLLYPVSPEKSIFVRETLQRLHEPFVNQKSAFVAHPFKFEKSLHSATDILEKLFKTYMLTTISRAWLAELLVDDDILVKHSSRRALRLLSLRGDEELERKEFEILINKECHLQRSYYEISKNINQVAMTIHAAKNREFDDVIILWPYEVRKNEIYKRKLLYNAITRAKRNAVIIVQAKNEASFKKDKVLALFDNVDIGKKKKSAN